MSFFSIGVLLWIIYALFTYKREKGMSRDRFLGLLFLWVCQLFFIWIFQGIEDFVIFVGGSSLTLWATRAFRTPEHIRKAVYPLVVSMLALLLYVEFFNGLHTFDHFAKHQEYHSALKTHYLITPYKVTQPEQPRYGEEAVVAHLPRMLGHFFIPTPLKKNNTTMYYYEAQRFGENGRWWKFGVSKATQVQ